MSSFFITILLTFIMVLVVTGIGIFFNSAYPSKSIFLKNKRNEIIFDCFACLLVALIASIQFNSFPLLQRVPATDSAVFLHIGKMMHDGAIPYKDLFDHKGMIMYFIQYLATFCRDINIGLWIVEVLNMAIFAYLILKISVLFTKNKIAQLVTVSVICCVCIRKLFQGGNYVEEYALPWIAWSLYLFFKWFKSEQVKFIDVMCIGASFSIVFFLRPNMIGVWVALIPIIMVILISKREWSNLLKCILCFCVGMLIVCGILLVYFLFTDSFNEMIDSYFKFNFLYTDSLSGVIPFFVSALTLSVCTILMIPTLLFTFVSEIKRKNVIYIYNFVALAITIVMAAISGRRNHHYAIIFLPLLVLPLVLTLEKLFSFVESRVNIKKSSGNNGTIVCAVVIAVVLIGYNLIAGYNLLHISPEENDGVVSYLTEHTQEEDDVLVLGNSCRYYLICNRITKNKYIYQYPPINVDNNIYESFMTEIKEKPSDFIVCLGDRSDNSAENTNIGKIYRYYDELCSKGEYNCFESEEDFYVYIKNSERG